MVARVIIRKNLINYIGVIMIFTDLSVEYNHPDDETDEEETYLIFYFQDNTLAFECPIGVSGPEFIDIFKKFIDKAEDIIKSEMIIH